MTARACAALALAIGALGLGPRLRAQAVFTGPTGVDLTNQGEPALNPAKSNPIYTIDPSTGVLSLHIPILTVAKSGRGPAVTFSILYNTGMAPQVTGYVQPPGYGPGTTPYADWAWSSPGTWSLGQPGLTIGSAIYPWTESSPNGGPGDDCFENAPFIYTDAGGSSHDLGLISVDDPSLIYTCPDEEGQTDTAADDNSLLGQLSNGDSQVSATSGDGTRTTFNALDQIQSIEDANGNLVTVSYGNGGGSSNTETWTDAAGRVVLQTDVSSSGATVETFDASGNPQTYTLAFTAVNFPHFTMANPNDNNCGVPYPGCMVYDLVSPTNGDGAGANVIDQVSSLTLPDGTAYSFGYDPTYGTVNRIGLPGGGTVNFTYAIESMANSITSPAQGGGELIVPADSVVVASETVNSGMVSGTWTYNYSTVNPGMGYFWTSKQTQITDPAGTVTTLSYQPVLLGGARFNGGMQSVRALETGRSVAAAGGTVLRTVATAYGYLLPSSVTTVLDPGGTNQAKRVNYAYDYYNNPIEEDDYDFGGGGTPGALLKKTVRTFLASQTAYSPIPWGPPWIVSPKTSETVTDGNGNTLAQTAWGYDSYPHGLSLSGAVQHDPAFVGSGVTLRGNLTSESNWVSGGTWLTTATQTFDDAGNVLSSADANGNVTTYGYADAWANAACAPSGGQSAAFVTSVANALNQVTAYTYNSCSGSMAAKTDPNNQTWSYAYNDSLNRPTQEDFPDGGETTISYTDTAGAFTVETQRKIDATRWTDAWESLDGLGRPALQSTANDEATPWDQTVTRYDALGRVAFSSYPCQASSATAAACTTGETFLYDALSRPTQTAESDGSTFLTSYAGRATETQDEGNGTSRVTKITQVNGLGHLDSVCEVTGAADAAGTSPAACGQDIGATGFFTRYRHDALGNLLEVRQGEAQQPRVFQYDGLSRLLSATNPESGLTGYTYDNDSNVATRTRPAPNQSGAATVTTSYTWDALNRLTGKSYSDGVTPPAAYVYDGALLQGFPLSNTVGRLSWETAGTTLNLFSYDPLGRTAYKVEFTGVSWNGTGVWEFAADYDQIGDTLSFSDGSWTPVTAPTTPFGAIFTATYVPSYGMWQPYAASYNRAGRLTGVTSVLTGSHYPASLVSGLHYNASGEETAAVRGTAGAGLQSMAATWGYDARGRMTAAGAGESGGNGAYGWSGQYSGNGDLTSENDSGNGNWTYGFDAQNRLTSSACTAACPDGTASQGYSYVYDRFGNRWGQNLVSGSGPAPNASFTGGNNRMDGYAYDAAGDLTNDGSHSYGFDAEGRLTSVDGGTTATYNYDAEGERAERLTPGLDNEDYARDLAGHRTGVYHSGSWAGWVGAEVYVAGQHVGRYDNSDLRFPSSNAVGTERALTFAYGTGSATESVASLPFGDAENPFEDIHFTGKPRDYESGLDNFGARYYSSQLGRFLTPDWSDDNEDPVPNADLTDPQSLNLYAYAGNNPVTNTDADGHICIFGFGNTCSSTSNTAQSTPAQCTSDPCEVHAADEPSLLHQAAATAVLLAVAGVQRNVQTLNAATATPAAQSVTLPDGTLATTSIALIVPPAGEIEDLISSAVDEGGSLSRILSKPGGFEQAMKDFDALSGTAVEKSTGAIVKNLSDGSTAILRDFSSDGRPTLEIQHQGGEVTKIRYGGGQ